MVIYILKYKVGMCWKKVFCFLGGGRQVSFPLSLWVALEWGLWDNVPSVLYVAAMLPSGGSRV